MSFVTEGVKVLNALGRHGQIVATEAGRKLGYFDLNKALLELASKGDTVHLRFNPSVKDSKAYLGTGVRGWFQRHTLLISDWFRSKAERTFNVAKNAYTTMEEIARKFLGNESEEVVSAVDTAKAEGHTLNAETGEIKFNTHSPQVPEAAAAANEGEAVEGAATITKPAVAADAAKNGAKAETDGATIPRFKVHPNDGNKIASVAKLKKAQAELPQLKEELKTLLKKAPAGKEVEQAEKLDALQKRLKTEFGITVTTKKEITGQFQKTQDTITTNIEKVKTGLGSLKEKITKLLAKTPAGQDPSEATLKKLDALKETAKNDYQITLNKKATNIDAQFEQAQKRLDKAFKVAKVKVAGSKPRAVNIKKIQTDLKKQLNNLRRNKTVQTQKGITPQEQSLIDKINVARQKIGSTSPFTVTIKGKNRTAAYADFKTAINELGATAP